MPFLRVLRDKRGYETTYLIHWYQDGHRHRSRILYMFRTPGGVQVGRAPLEPEVLRDIEARHPEIAFDWKAVVESRQIIESAPDARRPRKRVDGDDERAAVAEGTPSAPSGTGPGEEPGPAPAAAPAVPLTIEGSTADEQMTFLALWYPILRDRVGQRPSDPVRRESLLALAERLNPSGWIDADQIAAGLQQATESLGRLAHALSRRRRRSRRTSTRPPSAAGADGTTPNALAIANEVGGPAPDELSPDDGVADSSPEEE